MNKTYYAIYDIGQVIRHRIYGFRGVIFDVDWIPARGDVVMASDTAESSLFYRLFAEDDRALCSVCIAEHDLLPDLSSEPVMHPQIEELFDFEKGGKYRRRMPMMN